METKTETTTATPEGCCVENSRKTEPPANVRRDINWILVIFLLHLNVLGALGIYMLPGCYISTILYTFTLIFFAVLGVTAGSHRLWAHRSYVGSKQLRIFLMLCHTLAGVGPIYDWVAYHRIHHKYRHTSLDPFDSRRGFLHSQFVSFVEYPAEIDERVRKEISVKDLERDEVVMFQKRYYWFLYVVFTILLTINAPAEYWGEHLLNAFIVSFCFRYFVILNVAQLIYSAPLIWSIQPGEKYPPDSNIVFFIQKSFWIDFHYVAPWDYLSGEFGAYGTDFTSAFVRVMAALGHATELKTVSGEAMREAMFQSVSEGRPLADCVAKLEHVAVERAYYLEPLKVMA